jgi:putative membrane protein insertion efficiency factor
MPRSAPGPTSPSEPPLPVRAVRRAVRLAIRGYQLTLSSLMGRWCRHMPSCSAYMDEAIARHGLWAGGWMGTARLCRCQPWGTSGYDPVPERPPPGAGPLTFWRYGQWRGPLVCEAVEPPGER